jgi:hypothetical protein
MSSPSIPSPFIINVPDSVLRDLADRRPRPRLPQRTAARGRPAPPAPATTGGKPKIHDG